MTRQSWDNRKTILPWMRLRPPLVFQTLLIGLLVASCITTTGQQTAEPTSQSSVETPGVTSSPTHPPEANPSPAPTSTPIARLVPTKPPGQVLPAGFTLDDPAVQSILKSYLVQNVGFVTYGGKAFCAYFPLVEPVREPDGATVHLYLWVLCQEYYREGQGLQKGTGVSLPVAIELVGAPGGYQFNSYKVPRDGTLYPKDIQAEFPPSTWEGIWPTSQEEVEAANARIQQLEAETKAEADREFAAAPQLTPSTSTLLEPIGTPLPTPAPASSETPGNLPEQYAQASQIEAIDAIRALLDLPQLPLEFVEMTTMVNSPNGDLAVALYQDTQGRKYSVVPSGDQVVEIDALAVLSSISPQAPPLSKDELRAKAEAFIQAAIPDFESRRAGLAYEAGVKGDNYFFDWRAASSPGAAMPPFVQIGLYKSGELFAYYNTLNQNVEGGATLTGQVIAGYGNHQPISGLPLRVRQKGDGGWDTYTDGNGQFTLTDLPVGDVIVEDDHLIFQVTIDSPTQSIDLGKLKYPLIHPPDYYWWQAAPLADPGQLLRDGQAVAFVVCTADSNWVRPDLQAQREQVYTRLPFSQLNEDRFIKFEQVAVLYDTVDVTQQSYPGGLNLDEVGADWLYLTGLWTAARDPLTNSNCSYAPGDLGSLLDRSQLEVWLFGYRATGVQELDKEDAEFADGALCDPSERSCTVRSGYHYAVNVVPASGFQIIRFAGEQDVVAIHIVESGKEILALP
jgi:hypothetical protein